MNAYPCIYAYTDTINTSLINLLTYICAYESSMVKWMLERYIKLVGVL